MGKVKIKRKSTLIDMTAMSDVTVLLLTFFMLTSTFLQKEPTIVYTPSSVSEEKVPVKNLVTVLVSPADKSGKLDDPTVTEGKIFISFAGDSILPGEVLRTQILDKAVAIYNSQARMEGKEKLQLTAQEKDAFAKTNMMGTPFRHLKEVLGLDVVQRDKLMGDLANPQTSNLVGIPISPITVQTDDRHLNDFQIWMKALKQVAQEARSEKLEKEGLIEGVNTEEIRALDMLYNSLMQGQSISIKADKDTPFSVVNVIFENLRYMELNKFTMMTALKSMEQ